MNDYTPFVFDDKLISPVTGHSVSRLTKQNIAKFGYASISDLHAQFPGFPTVCKTYRDRISVNSHAARLTGIHNRTAEKNKLKAELEEIKQANYLQNPKICECGNLISYDKRNNKFCSRKCANSKVVTPETKDKIRQTLAQTRPAFSKACEFCGQTMFTRMNTCSRECMKNLHYARSATDYLKLKTYRSRCSFKFNLATYPEEFDFTLIQENGWYVPKNKGGTGTGVSRDHMLSVRFGYDNNISPEIMSHPANCKLILQSENASKSSACSITLSELEARIAEWNKKYQ